jgi:hypothetical protein
VCLTHRFQVRDAQVAQQRLGRLVRFLVRRNTEMELRYLQFAAEREAEDAQWRKFKEDNEKTWAEHNRREARLWLPLPVLGVLVFALFWTEPLHRHSFLMKILVRSMASLGLALCLFFILGMVLEMYRTLKFHVYIHAWINEHNAAIVRRRQRMRL